MSENTDCGCGPSSDKSYFMVEATASDTPSCGGSSSSGTEGCAKQEPMYDVCLSSFLVPLSNSFTSMEVCNPNIYYIGMWLQFLTPSVTLQISNISGKIISLINRCENGDLIYGNPDAGQAILRNTPFVVVDKPRCKSDEDDSASLTNALSVATELCVPSFQTSSATATVRPVGRIESDEADLSVKKCIRGIFGILFKKGTPVLSSLKLSPVNDSATTRRLVKHRTTHEVTQIKNYHESDGLAANSQYTLAISSNEEKVVGPMHNVFIKRKLIQESGNVGNPDSWPLTEGSFSIDIDIAAIAPDLLPTLQGNAYSAYYAMARLEIAVNKAENGPDPILMRASMNGTYAGRTIAHVMSGDGPNSIQFNTISMPVLVQKADNIIQIFLVTNASARYYYRLAVDGIYF